MNRIDRKFEELKRQKKKAFIAYITAGDPNFAMTKKMAFALERSGADIIELGIPFSDPLADGPTIQAASRRALEKKATLKRVFVMVSQIRKKTAIPLVFMTYYNPVLKYGVENFFRKCKACGVDGVIVPDLPYEESDEMVKLAKQSGIAAIFLVAPTSTIARIRQIAKRSKGFIYYVSLTGVTGARTKLPKEVISNVRRVKRLTGKPVAVGFGIANARQAASVAKAADGVIIGSAIVKIIGEKKNAEERVFRFARSLARAIHNV
ncbi:MAG: tryptophan synthase subunit alpha [Candidatus Omnitrophota bacterium]|nr:tryptophan synthase subunit alpha [Candidatus Omnitrophota bacterium]